MDFRTISQPAIISTVDTLVSVSLQAVAYIHHKHLTTTSYETHKALNEFYNNAPEFIDAIAESYIGSGYLLSDDISFKVFSKADVSTHLKELKQIASNAHKSMTKYNELGVTTNIENYIAFIDSILYKLRLK